MRLTRAADYGIRALLHLALQPPEKVSLISEISRAQDIPEKYLSKILQTLTRGGIVRSFRGVKGGFALAVKPEQVTLKDAVECLEGPVAMNRCLEDSKECDRTSRCPVHPVWEEAQKRFLEVLHGTDLKALAESRRA